MSLAYYVQGMAALGKMLEKAREDMGAALRARDEASKISRERIELLKKQEKLRQDIAELQDKKARLLNSKDKEVVE
jgi:hypothetical protein